MGFYRPCWSVNGSSIELIDIELYDEQEARTQNLFDDDFGEPILTDPDEDGIGDWDRPGTLLQIKGKVRFSTFEEQVQEGGGNDPNTLMTLTVAESELRSKDLIVDGVCKIRPNDRVLKVSRTSGQVRIDMTHAEREGIFVVEARPGETGSGIWTFILERRHKTVDR